MAESAQNVAQILLAFRGGNHEALQQLLPLVYGELRRLARHHLRRRKREETFESKALVKRLRDLRPAGKVVPA